MDAFLVRQIVSDLSRELPGAIVSKVHQPAEREIVLVLWTGRGERRLLLSADPELCRIHLTTRKTENPRTPPRFCSYLRRHLEGMRVAGLAAAPFDRSVKIDFASSRPESLHDSATLYAELFGRHANLICVDGAGKIMEPLRAVSAEESRIREVAAGLLYRPLPRPDRPFLPDFTEKDAERVFAAGTPGEAGRSLQRAVSGLGRELAESAAAGAACPRDIFLAVRNLVRRYEEGDFAPGIAVLPTGKKRLLPFPCPGTDHSSFIPFPSANEAADRFYADVAESRENALLRQRLTSRIAGLLKKLRHTMEKVGGDEERLREGLAGAAHGETLKANLSRIRRGMEEFAGIPLDPAKGPVENMERYFRLAKKARRAVDIVRSRTREVAESIYYLESLEEQLKEAGTREELIALRHELSEAHPEKPVRGERKGKEKAPATVAPIPQVERIDFLGYAILVGRNNVGNDRIVRELAAPEDLWLHVQGIPGSHVLVRRVAGSEIPREVVEEAARLAVLHSRAKGSSNVPVFLAAAKDVGKFKGAKPGLVRIASYTTINVR